MKKILNRCVVLYLLFLMIGCNDTASETDELQSPSYELTIVSEHTSMLTGVERQLEARLVDSDNVNILSDDDIVSWSSSDESIATVNQQGLVYGRTPGEIIISVSVTKSEQKYVSRFQLTITEPVISSLSIESNTREINVDEPITLSVMATFTDGSEVTLSNDFDLEWTVSDSTLVNVVKSGDGAVLTGNYAGTVTVFVSVDSVPARVEAQSIFMVNPKSYSISIESDDLSFITRSVFDGYDIDDVYVKQNSATDFELLNPTPRYLNKPLIKLNDYYIRIDTFVSPFQIVKFEAPEWFKETLVSVQYVEEKPFFKTNIKTYSEINSSDHFVKVKPTEEHVSKFEKEIRGIKQLMNSYDYNHTFVGYIEEHMKSLSLSLLRSSNDEEHWCSFEEQALLASTRSIDASSNAHTNFKGSDSSPHTIKHVSMIAHKPDATYGILIGDPAYSETIAGVATLGNGWLTVRDSVLYQTGNTLPHWAGTFFHEKMHNHGFSHSGGMTTGYPRQMKNYVNQYWRNFYDDGVLEKLIPTLAVNYSLVDLGEQFRLDISFLDKTEMADSSRSVDKFLLLTTSLPELKQSYVIDEESNFIDISPKSISSDGNTYTFENIEDVQSIDLNQLNSGYSMSKLAFVFDKPAQAITDGVPASLILISGSDEDETQQGNIIINYSGTSGFINGDSDYVYIFTDQVKNDEGRFDETSKSYTPVEAELICKDKGLNLGMLKPFASTEMMDFQSKYLQYGSQVGLSYETGLPVAVSVPTTYRSSLVKEVDKGAVIVCSK